MYFTQDVNAVGCPHVVRMSFELPYLDWCRFQKSQLFHDLTEYLEEKENKKLPCKTEQQLEPYRNKDNVDYTQMRKMISDVISNAIATTLEVAQFIEAHQEQFSSYPGLEPFLRIFECFLDCSSTP